MASLYFAYTTLTTVGYGDISASTDPERIVALFGLVLGSAIFATIISTISNLAEHSNIREQQYRMKVGWGRGEFTRMRALTHTQTHTHTHTHTHLHALTHAHTTLTLTLTHTNTHTHKHTGESDE